MVVTAADLASAMFFLLLLEGFRRLKPEDFIFTRWRGRWRATGSPLSVAFRGIEWLWILPLQTKPGTFLSHGGNASWVRDSASSVDAAQRHVRESAARYRTLCLLTTIQACMILLLLPVLAAIGSNVTVYSGLGVVECLALVIAGRAWRDCGWHALKYAFYPPSSVFAVLDATLGNLTWFDFDATVIALLPADDAAALLRRHYRSLLFQLGQTQAERKRVEERIAAMMRVGKLDAGVILQPPKRSSDGIVTYCPACDGEFVIEAGECSDCPGVKLVSFATAAAT